MSINSSVLVDSGQEAANVFVAAGGTKGNAITTMYFCNRSGVSTTFSLHLVPPGGSANVNNICYSNKVITPGDTYIIDWEKLVLQNGATIRANANVGNAIVATVSSIGV